MILTTEAEKKTFLTELHAHIMRIYGQNVTESDRAYFKTQYTDNSAIRYSADSKTLAPNPMYPSKVELKKEGASSIERSIPREMMLIKHGSRNPFSMKIAKLTVLTELYNLSEAAIAANPVKELDLAAISQEVRKKYPDIRVNDAGKTYSVDQVMHSHRRNYFRDDSLLGKFLRFLFPAPKSEQFLKKYSFFEEAGEANQKEESANQRTLR